jgi:hypothetical protein
MDLTGSQAKSDPGAIKSHVAPAKDYYPLSDLNFPIKIRFL